MTAFQLSAAYIVDLIFGDPVWMGHPVRIIGKTEGVLERKLLNTKDSPLRQGLLGGVLAVFIFGGVGLFTWGIVRFSQWIHPALSACVIVFLAYTTLATRNLFDEVRRVAHVLEQGNLTEARNGVGLLVSRDTGSLDEQGICRALIETVSENTSDGIVAPLFYLVLGGPALAMAYKALNTLDSMVGYKNERYRYFGWASARADDLANLIPARLTAFFYVLAAMILGKNWRGACRIAWRHGRNNTSPNSGYPEAAVAGALGIQLGGKNVYFGKPVEKPLIGNDEKPIGLGDVRESLRLMVGTSLIAALAATMVRILVTTL